MSKRYSITDFITKYMSGEITESVIVEDSICVKLSNKLIPFMLMANNSVPINTVDRLTTCMDAISMLNPSINSEECQYEFLSQPSTTPIDSDTTLNNKLVENNESSLSQGLSGTATYVPYSDDSTLESSPFPLPYNANRAKTDWYSDVLNFKVSYAEMLVSNRALLRKQRIGMFINHLFCGKTPLLYYLYDNYAYDYYENMKRDAIYIQIEKYANSKALDKRVQTILDRNMNGDVNFEELTSQLYRCKRDHLIYKYEIDHEYAVKGTQMLCQLYNPDIDVNNITLEDILHSVLELVKEYCSFTEGADTGAILTVIFSRAMFAEHQLPTNKWTIFSSDIIKKHFSSFAQLPTVSEICNIFDTYTLADTPSFSTIKDYVDDYLDIITNLPTKNMILVAIMDLNDFQYKVYGRSENGKHMHGLHYNPYPRLEASVIVLPRVCRQYATILNQPDAEEGHIRSIVKLRKMLYDVENSIHCYFILKDILEQNGNTEYKQSERHIQFISELKTTRNFLITILNQCPCPSVKPSESKLAVRAWVLMRNIHSTIYLILDKINEIYC